MSLPPLDFETWYKQNEAYLVMQPLTNYVAAAAWIAGRNAAIERCAALLDAEHAKRAHLDNHAAVYARMLREMMP